MMTECPLTLHRRVLQLSCENEHEGLLPDCTVGVRVRAKTKLIQVECIGSMHGRMQGNLRLRDKAGCKYRTAGMLASGARLA